MLPKLETLGFLGFALMLLQISNWQLQVSAKKCQEVAVVKWLNTSESYVKTLLRKPAISIFAIGGMEDHCREVCRDYVHALYNVPKFASAPTGDANLDTLIARGSEFVKAQKDYLQNPDECESKDGTACLSFWGWTQNAETPDASCSCGAIIRALQIRKKVKDHDCSREKVEQRFSDRFNPFGFYLFPATNNDDVDCHDRHSDIHHQSRHVADTWQVDDLCQYGGGNQLQPHES